jgi:hypothetical protein
MNKKQELQKKLKLISPHLLYSIYKRLTIATSKMNAERIEKVYEVRVYYCDEPMEILNLMKEDNDYLNGPCDFVSDDETGEWEFNNLETAQKVFNLYKINKMNDDELLVITETCQDKLILVLYK